MNSQYAELFQPAKLWSRAEILSSDCPLPKKAGVYAWYFRNFPGEIPIDRCITINGLTLLYVGIVPKKPPQNGKPPSKQTLHDRVRYHMNGNAYGSTLRLSLGCVLRNELRIQLRRVGNGRRMTFVDGEYILSEWMTQNAFVTWVVHPQPWKLEEELVRNLSLPLNLDYNEYHPFYPTLSMLRTCAKDLARMLPIIKPSHPTIQSTELHC